MTSYHCICCKANPSLFSALALIGLQTTIVHSSCDEDEPVTKETESVTKDTEPATTAPAASNSNETKTSKAPTKVPIPSRALQRSLSKFLQHGPPF